MENPIKIDDLGVPLFLETPKSSSKFPKHQRPTVSKCVGRRTHQKSSKIQQLVTWGILCNILTMDLNDLAKHVIISKWVGCKTFALQEQT